MTRETFRGVDAAWLHMDRPVNTADVVAVLELEGNLAMSRFRRTLERRLLVHRRFRQRVVQGALGRPGWEDDPRFSLERHLVDARLGKGRSLEAYVSAVASEPLDLRHPPWRIHLLHGSKRGAIVAKLHHCIADGFALVAVLLSLADEATPERGRPHASGRLGVAAREPWSAAVIRRGPVLAACLARILALPPDPATALKRPLTGERRVAWSRRFPLRSVRAAARARSVTVNDILSAAVVGGLRRWLLESGERQPLRDLRALVPVNLRPIGGETTLGNEFGLVFLELPVGAPTSDERVERLHARMKELKGGFDALVTYGLLSVLGRLPTGLEQVINAFFTTKASLVLTNVPGPRQALRLAGRRIEHVMFWVPHPASLGMGISVLSYAGEVIVGVRSDTAVMSDPARLVHLVDAELRALLPTTARGWSGRRAQSRLPKALPPPLPPRPASREPLTRS